MGSYNIGSFNCKWGSFDPQAKKESIKIKNEKIQEIIKKQSLDILVLQEYWVRGGMEQQSIGSSLPPRWGIIGTSNMRKKIIEYSDEPTKEFTEETRLANIDNGSAVMWNSNLFELKPGLQKWNNLLRKIKLDHYLVRPAQIIRLKVKSIKKYEIRIINVHLTYSGNYAKKVYVHKDDYHDVIYGDKLFRPRPQALRPPTDAEIARQTELAECIKIYEKINNFVAIDEDEYATNFLTIIAGDFNLEPLMCNVTIIANKIQNGLRRKKTDLTLKVEDKTTVKRKIPLYGNLYLKNAYDHFIVNSEEGNIFKSACHYDTVCDLYNCDNVSHFNQLSDHIPIVLNISFNKGA